MQSFRRKFIAGMLAAILAVGYLPAVSGVSLATGHSWSSYDVAIPGVRIDQDVDARVKVVAGECDEHAACSWHYGCAPLGIPGSSDVAALYYLQRSWPCDASRIVTRSPGIPERPPRA